MKFQYGTIFSMDYDPNLRFMALYPANKDTWWAAVLADEHWGLYTPRGIALGWKPGSQVTFSPLNDGLIAVEDED